MITDYAEGGKEGAWLELHYRRELGANVSKYSCTRYIFVVQLTLPVEESDMSLIEGFSAIESRLASCSRVNFERNISGLRLNGHSVDTKAKSNLSNSRDGRLKQQYHQLGLCAVGLKSVRARCRRANASNVLPRVGILLSSSSSSNIGMRAAPPPPKLLSLLKLEPMPCDTI